MQAWECRCNATWTRMSIVGAALVLAFIWAAIHSVRYLFIHSRPKYLLPSVSNDSRRSSTSDTPTTHVFLKSFHLRLQTTAWNIYHDLLATELKKERTVFLSQALTSFYDLGSVFGILGMLTGLVILSWTSGLSTLSLARKIINYSNQAQSSVTSELVRRDLESAALPLPEYESFIKPIASCSIVVPFRLLINCADSRLHGSACTPTYYSDRCFPCSNNTRIRSCYRCCSVRHSLAYVSIRSDFAPANRSRYSFPVHHSYSLSPPHLLPCPPPL